MPEKEVEDLLSKYKERLRNELEGQDLERVTSREYNEFKNELLPRHFSIYEKACRISEKLLKIDPNKKKLKELQRSIETCHLNITPQGAASFAMLFPLLWMVLGSVIILTMFNAPLFFMMFFIISGLAMMVIFGKLPFFLANSWRLEASNQMVMSIFYVVTYMRHTSNLENAIGFAAEHLTGPLALDFKKVLWDTETEKFSSVKESMDHYLESWRDSNGEFVESFHLIVSSLYEGSESRRLDMLDKSLDVMLEETYEKMLHYAQNLKNPITMLHMLGIILPILGLVILPLVVSFMSDVKWYHLLMLYNIILPVAVFYLGKNILSKRPTGYGESDISKDNPEMKKYRNIVIRLGSQEFFISATAVAVLMFLLLFNLGMMPVYMHAASPEFDIVLGDWLRLLDYQETDRGIVGPYGLGAALISLLVTLSFAVGGGLYYKLKSHNIMKIREETKKLELEFSSALFQLGNRLGDGLPPEIAFSRVAETMKDSPAGKFFELVSSNVNMMGMSVNDAIFDKEHGALVYFPSRIIQSSMKVLSEASKKGTKIAAQAVINISRYIKEMHRVDERLKDILEDIISSMKSQIKFLTPVIAGIVIGITSMITTIILRLNEQMENLKVDTGVGGLSAMTELFGKGIPTFHFQIIVGIYVVQIIAIMTILVNGIENGNDRLNERYLLGTNLIRSGFLYCIVAGIIMLIFNMIAGQIMTL
ncbi:MAG: hypothetical protein KJ709_07590 [Nanoarchaeota archaeon]|nr:hypothetical protein [Nanoarchaeota archaeon]